MKQTRTRQRQSIAYINVTPLVDVLLILVAILMLLLPLYIKKLPVNLPKTQATAAAAPELSKSLLISLDESGKFYLDQAYISESELMSKINPAVSIKFAVGANVRYEDLAKAVTKLKEKAPKDISLVVM